MCVYGHSFPYNEKNVSRLKKQIMASLPNLATRQQLARYLCVTTRTIINYERRGLLTPLSVGGKRYYDQTEVENLLKK